MQWHFNENMVIFIEENVFENVAILLKWRLFCAELNVLTIYFCRSSLYNVPL